MTTGSRLVGVLGSGIMGAGIAETAARAGHSVILRSRELDTASGTLSTVEKRLYRQVSRGKLEEVEAKAVLARITATGNLRDLSNCDFVIESVVEDLAVKKRMIEELNHVVSDEAVVATNTSTLPVVELAMEFRGPERVCGIHFFNPAPVMQLVEIVRPITAADATIAAAVAFAESCGKTAVVVRDQAGFVVNALLFPYLNNAVRLLEQGVATKEGIDAAMQGGCNFPMGPLALLDLVGLDTSLAIIETLYAEYGDPNYAPVPLLKRMVAAGRLGRKSGEGFYDYARP